MHSCLIQSRYFCRWMETLLPFCRGRFRSLNKLSFLLWSCIRLRCSHGLEWCLCSLVQVYCSVGRIKFCSNESRIFQILCVAMLECLGLEYHLLPCVIEHLVICDGLVHETTNIKGFSLQLWRNVWFHMPLWQFVPWWELLRHWSRSLLREGITFWVFEKGRIMSTLHWFTSLRSTDMWSIKVWMVMSRWRRLNGCFSKSHARRLSTWLIL